MYFSICAFTAPALNQAPWLGPEENPFLESSLLPKLLTTPRLASLGAKFGDYKSLASIANTRKPELHLQSPHGHPLNRASYDSSYHALISLGVSSGMASLPFKALGTHKERALVSYLMNQLDPGICCPLTMTFASVPVFERHEVPELEGVVEKVLSDVYDCNDAFWGGKKGVTVGMSMTEKQGGSDVRANTTSASLQTDGSYKLHGHKWFTSAPNSDIFLTLAKVDGNVTCFAVPRWTSPESRNVGLHFVRLKEKMGDHSNASSEVEYHGATGYLVGEVGRGVQTIIDMVHHTRLECCIGSAAGMDRALKIAKNHVARREAFGKKLEDQPLMRHLVKDLELESKAATLLAVRMAESFDNQPEDEHFGRVGVPVAKFHVCKRQPQFVYECLEILGGNGYVETWPMARLFRASPLNSVWEGSGNVMALDVLRAFRKGGAEMHAALAIECGKVKGKDGVVDKYWAKVLQDVEALGKLSGDEAQWMARKLTTELAMGLQAIEMLRAAEGDVITAEEAKAFVESRIAQQWSGMVYGGSLAVPAK